MSLADSVIEIVKRKLPDLFLRGVFRFRVVKHRSGRLDLQPVAAKWIGDIELASVWPGIGGYAPEPREGTSVLISFIDASERDPVVIGFEPFATATRPIASRIEADTVRIDGNAVDLGSASGVVVRVGDQVSITPGNGSGVVAGTITVTSPPSKVRA